MLRADRSWSSLPAGVALAAVLAGCTSGSAAMPSVTAAPTTAVSASPSTTSTTTTGASSTVPTGPAIRPTSPATAPRVASFDAAAAFADVAAIAAFGPRDAVSSSYHRAATWVGAEFQALGYAVQAQPVPMPAGTSWGVRVPAGTTVNVIADPPGFDPDRPHVVLGAHLDTVPQAPGAEDNASGVAVLIELGRMLREQPAAVPVRLVAFGGEEARGGNGTRYAFGSRHLVTSLTPAQRQAVVGMIALDRVGVAAPAVPVCTGGRGTTDLVDAIRAAARGSTLATKSCRNRASDHVSFEAVGIPVARLGSVPYAAYHSSKDVPRVVDRAQLARTGNVVWAWLRSLR